MTLYNLNWEYTMKTLLTDLRIFWITFFGDESTINTITMVNDLADGVNNPFVLLDFLTSCTIALNWGRSIPCTFQLCCYL